METGSELVDIIRFLESKGLVCKVCGEEGLFFSEWDPDGGFCKAHRPAWNHEYKEKPITNRSYRAVFSRLQELLKTSGQFRSRATDAPLDTGGAPASELHSVHLGKELPAHLEEVASQLSKERGIRRFPSRDPLGADVHCHIGKR